MGDERFTPRARAALAYAVVGREIADYVRALVADLGQDLPPGERIHNTRIPRVQTVQLLDLAVIIEALSGSTWEEIADALPGGIDAAEARRRYEATVASWARDMPEAELDATIYGDLTTGFKHDHDPAGTAESVDAWLSRHAEPWDAAGDDGARGPVERALTTP